MSLKNIFGIAGTALNAQTIRMNTTASNLANASTVSPTEEEAFRAKRPVFKALVDQADLNRGFDSLGGVKVKEIVDDMSPFERSTIRRILSQMMRDISFSLMSTK